MISLSGDSFEKIPPELFNDDLNQQNAWALLGGWA
jgi:hypothetical protein